MANISIKQLCIARNVSSMPLARFGHKYLFPEFSKNCMKIDTFAKDRNIRPQYLISWSELFSYFHFVSRGAQAGIVYLKTICYAIRCVPFGLCTRQNSS